MDIEKNFKYPEKKPSQYLLEAHRWSRLLHGFLIEYLERGCGLSQLQKLFHSPHSPSPHVL